MTPSSVGASSAPGGHVLVVGNRPDERRSLRDVLEPLDRPVVEASPGPEAARHLAGGGVAVVVLDGRGLGADGVEAARALRAAAGPDDTPGASGPSGPPTPVVFVTGADLTAEQAAEAYELGTLDVVAAPVLPQALRAKVALLAELATRTRELAVLADRLRRADAASKRQQAALDALQTAMRAFAAGEPDETVMPRVAWALARGLEWQVSAYWTASRAALRCVDTSCDPSVPEAACERLRRDSTLGTGDGLVRKVWASGMPEWAPLARLEGDDEDVSAALDAGLAGAIAVPVTARSGRLGVIELLRCSPEPPDPQTVATLTAVSMLVSQFVQARRTQSEAETVKNEFFALVSHELLTPLTSMLGYLEDLLTGEAGEFNAEQQHDLGVVDRNARRLHRLIDDLMFVAQVEAGRLALDDASVDLAPIVLEAVENAQTWARGRSLEVVADVTPAGPVRGDPRRLGQVVDNLVSNAVKFSHEGGRIDVVLDRRWGEAVIDVIDRGHGIPLDELERIFERFFRSSIATTREVPGIGLGLSISKAIVEAHGGSIACDSVEGEGATFSIALPLEMATIEGGPTTDQGAAR